MENAEETMQILERFTRLKQKEIPKELEDYLQYVAKTGDTVFKWANLKYLFREKLLNVITHFHDTTPRMDEIPQYPNVDPFNYESMKSSLLERLESFNAAPFTIQRLSELLIDPRKQYNRIDKFMRALEKNILVVSTVEPGRKRTESENGDSLDSVVNGDLSLDVNVDIDMDNEPLFNMEAQNGKAANGNGVSPTEADVINNEVKSADEKIVDSSTITMVTKVDATHEPPRADDEDLQPSPKKAKLDVGDNVETTAKISEEICDGVAKSSADTVAEKPVSNEEGKVVVDSSSNEEKKEKEKTDIEKVETEAKPATVEENVAVSAVEKAEKVETDIKKTTSDEPQSTTMSVAAAESENKTIEVSVNSSAAQKLGKGSSIEEKLEDVAAALDKADETKEAAEKIIEKQEIEKGEKIEPASNAPTQGTDDASTITTTTPTSAVDSNEKPKAVDVAETKEAAVVENIAEIVEKAKPIEAEPSTKTDSAEADSTASQQKTDETAAAASAVAVSDAKLKEATTSEAEASNVEAVAVPAVESKTETATITSSSSTTTDAEVSTASESAAIVAEATPATKTDDIAVEATTPAVVATIPSVPVLALNDQPMEEDAALAATASAVSTSIDAAAPAGVIAAVVDEVIMAESSTATPAVGVGTVAVGETTEMAMDETSTAKADEPGTDTMDVDDTSQQEEAMDQ